MQLSSEHSDCLSVIEAHRTAHGGSPTYREIMARAGLSSTSRVHKLVWDLRESGHLNKLVDRRDALALTDLGKAALEELGQSLLKTGWKALKKRLFKTKIKKGAE